jgi:methanogenic corrinoid protein MtbC1
MQTIDRGASEAVIGQREALAVALVDIEFSRQPGLEKRYGPAGREKCLQDARFHLSYLAEALAFGNRALFVDYIAWAKVMLSRRRVPAEHLASHLQLMAQVLRERLPAPSGEQAAGYIEAAARAMPQMPDDLPSFHTEGEPLSPLAHQYEQALLRGERHVASRLVLEALERGSSVSDIYLRVFQPTQYEVGRLWQIDSIGVAEEHYCTAATQLVMSQMYPHLLTGPKNGRTLVATCVSGDQHEMGVRMVADFFEMAGWDTFYTGANTPHQAVVDAVIARSADVLAISATITYHLHDVSALVQSVRARPECAHVKILVGGYPFNRNPDLWRQVGADGSGRDAEEAIGLATEWVAGSDAALSKLPAQ